MKNITGICENFMMKDKCTAVSVGTKESEALWSSEDEGDRFEYLVKGSEPDWPAILVELSDKFKVRAINMADKSHIKIHDLALSLLGDINSFPGIVTCAVRTLYLKHTYSSHHSAVSEARRGLDQIASSIFCVLPTEVVSDFDEMKSVINLADRYTLSKNDNSMYEKVMTAATALAHRADEGLFHHLNKSYSEPIDDSTCGHMVTDAFFKVLQAVTALDKLIALSHALRACVAEDVIRPSERPAAADSQKDLSGEVTRRRKSGNNTDIAPHGADALIERLIAVICFLSKRYKLRWHAQCTFIELMCPDTSWLYGAEGYSLVTLQQVLNTLQRHGLDSELMSVSGSSHGGALLSIAGTGTSAAAVAPNPSIGIGAHLDNLRSASADDFATE